MDITGVRVFLESLVKHFHARGASIRGQNKETLASHGSDRLFQKDITFLFSSVPFPLNHDLAFWGQILQVISAGCWTRKDPAGRWLTPAMT